MLFDDRRLGEEHFTDSSPDYALFSRQAMTALGVAAALIVATLGLMVVMRGTVFATGTVWLYTAAPGAPLIGVIVFGAALTVGRSVGLEASAAEHYGKAFAASGLLAVAYGAFGAGVLAFYPGTIHVTALGVAAAITAAITVIAGGIVYTTDRSFSRWSTYSGVVMLFGLLAAAAATVSPPFRMLAFWLFLLGFVIDLFYEIYMVSEQERSPVANGIGIYVAFMGVFVHILQLVLRYMARNR